MIAWDRGVREGKILRPASWREVFMPVKLNSGNRYPYDSREQWTDACNVLALKEGVVIGYDRNEETIAEFEKYGFTAILAKDLLKKCEQNFLPTFEFLTIPNSIV